MTRAPRSTLTRFVVRTDLRTRWRMWLFVGRVVGLVAGAAMALAAGARRTATTFDRYVAATDAADIMLDAAARPGVEDVLGRIRAVDGVEDVVRFMASTPRCSA